MHEHYLSVLTIAGSDSSGGAGIQADIKTMSALGVYAASVITAVTAQNTTGVFDTYVLPPSIIQSQIRAVLSDIFPRAIKIGMLGKGQSATAVADALAECDLPIVLDPVMVSTSGHRLADPQAVSVIRERLLPQVLLVTPNLPEAEELAGIKILTPTDMRHAAQRILELGVQAVLIKGGHASGSTKRDFLLQRDGQELTLEATTVLTPNTHGTGCTLSSAIAAELALGCSLSQAVQLAKHYLHQALEAGAHIQIGAGHGPVNHFFSPLPLRTVTTEDTLTLSYA